MDSVPPKQKNNTYILDPESAAEMGRLILQDQMVTQAMGGLFPEQSKHSQLSPSQKVLDIGCGPGGWITGVAQQYPFLDVWGIDISELMVNFTITQAKRLDIANVHVLVMNALEPLEFADNSFDLINIRMAFGWVRNSAWPSLLQECFRVLRPGGHLRWTEGDFLGLTTSLAYQEIQTLGTKLFQRLGYGFSPDGLTFGMTPMMGYLVSQVGCISVSSHPHLLDFSWGTPLYQSQKDNVIRVLKASHPVIVQTGIATADELSRLETNVIEDMNQETFRGLGYILTVIGEKPGMGS